MQNFSSSPKEMVGSFWRNRSLIKALVQREVIGRYRGSIFGLLWSFINPVFMLLVYTFVFSVVFKAKWGGGSDSKIEFALILFAGLIIFNLFAECINRAPSLILSNANYVKKVVFPLEIFPWVSLGTAIFHSLISLCVWLIAYIIFYGMPHLTVLLMPLIMLPFIFLIMGLSWGLSALGVYLRDISQLVGILTTALMFLSPIFYPITALPENYQRILLFNPLTHVIEFTRDIIFWGRWPDMTTLLLLLVANLLIAYIGFVFFQKSRKGFADVL
jgi:lipopolysaccharide transport system permease protein